MNPQPKILTTDNDPLHIIKTRFKTHGRPATIQGPMVRYSKLAFRELCHFYNTDITYTPMILGREFVRNKHARLTDISLSTKDVPVIAQLGVNNTQDLLKCIEMLCPYVDGFGINCGCPIKEQVREGIGAALIYNEDLMVDMVRVVKLKYGDKLRLEMKIRIHEHDTPQRTLVLCERLCEAGVDWITVHGRMKNTRSSYPVDLNAIKFIVDALKLKGFDDIPVVANGDCFNIKDLHRIAEFTGCQAVMSARGVLANPALFAGFNKCPWHCLERFIYLCIEIGGLPIQLILHHVYCMLENMSCKRSLLKQIMNLKSLIELLGWLEANFYFHRKNDSNWAQEVQIRYKEQPVDGSTPSETTISMGELNDALEDAKVTLEIKV